MSIIRKLSLLQIALSLILLIVAPSVSADNGHVVVLRVDGVINPVTANYIDRGIGLAEQNGARAVVIELDTPGGLDTAMRDIITRIVNAQIPVIVYVYPQGARAASAGAFIAMAGHVAAMAPNTSIGSAHPVFMGSPAGDSAQPDKTMEEKVTNDAVSRIKSLAERRGRNVEFAEKMVRESANATESEALKLRVVDLLSPDLPSLLDAANGRVVELAGGQVTVQTISARIDLVEMNVIERFLLAISDPNIAYILMILGINGLIFELANPGSIFPGVVGGICLLLGFFALGTLPVNYAGLALIVFAFILFIAEIKIQSHGLLLAGGILSMLLGSMLLVNTEVPYFTIPWTTIAAVVGATSAFFIFVVGKAAAVLHRRASTGREGLIDAVAETRTDLDPRGIVFLQGERWEAIAEDANIPRGAKVRVVAIQGFRLLVRKA
ncbi:MAG: nodulation protein NfeD [Chloroflexi bacterium]|nr:nodulation protein NfeD [Chloroflexota bacterium]